MRCQNCNHSIKPGMEITVQQGNVHCPFCLYEVVSDGETSEETNGIKTISVDRFARRREVRRRLVEQLRRDVSDDFIRCPNCEYQFNNNTLVALESSEHLICPRCSRDIAYEAYRHEAYDERSWLDLVATIADMKAQEKCANCRYLGVAARVCQTALSWSHGHDKQQRLLASMVRHPDQDLPDAGCYESCPVVQRWHQEAAKLLLLL